jgi:hypothetical protein
MASVRLAVGPSRDPTATHSVADTHDTPARELSKAAPRFGLGVTAHTPAERVTTNVRTRSLDEERPTATQWTSSAHETASSSLLSPVSGLGMADHGPPDDVTISGCPVTADLPTA